MSGIIVFTNEPGGLTAPTPDKLRKLMTRLLAKGSIDLEPYWYDRVGELHTEAAWGDTSNWRVQPTDDAREAAAISNVAEIVRGAYPRIAQGAVSSTDAGLPA